MQKAPSLFLRWTFPALTTLNTHSDAAEEATPSETAHRSAEAVITKQCQEEWDSGTDSCCRLQLVEKDGHAVTLWPQISPPHPEKRRTKTDTFHLSSLLFIVFWSEGAIYSPLFCFTSGFVRVPQSPSQHNVRVWNPGEGQWELDVTLIQLRFITQTGPQLDVVFGKAKKLDCLRTVYSALTVWVKLGFSSAC